MFAVGIIGTGLMAVPILAGSAAYAVGEALRWPVGLARKPKAAARFLCDAGSRDRNWHGDQLPAD